MIRSEFEVNNLIVRKEMFSKKILSVCLLLFFLFFPTFVVNAANTDDLYTQIDDGGNYIDGNRRPIVFDKPVIRPTFFGKAIIDDTIGPNGKFKGFWGEQNPIYTDDHFGQEYSIQAPTVIKNVGYYQGKSLALRINYTKRSPSWTEKVTLTRDGGLNISPNSFGIEFQLVYNDDIFKTPVEDVYVEFPVLSNPTGVNKTSGTYSRTAIKQSNLLRTVFNEDFPNKITNVVTRERYPFKNALAEDYMADSLIISHQFRLNESQFVSRVIKQTFIFDNKEPLVLAESLGAKFSTVTTLFKSDMKTPWEVSYLPPRTNGSQNTSKFEAEFDITQAVNDGYEQYFPETLSLVMLDDQNMFESIQLSDIHFKDQNGKDISGYFEKMPINHHQLEFRIKKSDLIKLGSNQINVTLAAGNLDSEAVLKRYDKTENVYMVPVKFYNYKIYKGKKTESDKMTAIAKITPNIYGEAADDVTMDQYTYSRELDVKDLLKNVATTIPGDSLETEIIDKSIYFDTVKTYNVDVRISSKTSTKTKIVSVPVRILKAVIVTSDYFENQEWLIDEVNRQFASKNKKIDQNLYMRDLLGITSIINQTGDNFKGQHIPKTISALKSLKEIELGNKALVGQLPNELGSLTELTKLSISNNSFSGSIPESLVNLKNLEFLALEMNGLTGTIPLGLEKLPNLKQIYLNNNKLVGSLAKFDLGPFSNFNISENQLTYNDKTEPSFITKPIQYQQTFVAGTNSLSLTSITTLKIVSNGTKIKPFDSTNEGFLNIYAQKKDQTRVELYSGHTFKIINKKTNKIIYDGPASEAAEVIIDSGENYQVVMDNADKNPNNVTEFETKLREYKLSEVPKSLSLDLKLGELDFQPVKISSEDTLSIFDNRVNSQWQLKLKPSELKSETRTMLGSYFYKAKDGIPIEVPITGSFKTIESGNSEPFSETINLSKEWNDKRGLFYKQSTAGNYKDSYTGKLEWQIVDAPTGQ